MTTTGFNENTLKDIAAGEPAWLQAQRTAAWETFTKLPFPGPRDAEWRRFNLRPLKFDALITTPVVVTLSAVPNGAIFCELREAITKYPDLVKTYLGRSTGTGGGQKFAALHAAFWQGGVFAHVPRGVKLTAPLEVTYHLSGGASALPHSLVVVEPGAEATFVQRFTGGPRNGTPILHASGTEVFVEEAGKLHYVSLQNFAPGVFDFTVKRAHIARDAEIDWVLGMFGGSFLRYDVDCAMEGPGGNSFMYGVSVGDGQQQFGQFTRQHHTVGNTVSDLLFKNVYRDQATGVYSGIIRVEKNANGTNAYQANRNLVLNDTVKCDTRPLLEIESNDLRCTHGATVGRLDENQLYYLRSRGLNETQARELLIEGFLEPVLARIKVESVYKEFGNLIHQKVTR
jgi:Fe-S cluster assembly protein SufD